MSAISEKGAYRYVLHDEPVSRLEQPSTAIQYAEDANHFDEIVGIALLGIVAKEVAILAIIAQTRT